MSSADRSAWRNTFLYDSNNRDTVLGGLWATPGITNANLYSMLEIFCLFSNTFELYDEDGQSVGKDEAQLLAGNYYIVTEGTIILTNEVPLLRTISLQSGTRVAAFRDEVRERDRACVFTAIRSGRWRALQAAHIFPLAYEGYWNDHNYGRWITIPPANHSHGLINSVQNGILLTSDMHQYFDSYDLTINPDDNYKIVSFAEESLQYNIAGQLNQSFLDNPLRPVDQLLRWHFRQAVLTNMKGAGEPCFETDFPPGTDMMGEIMNGPKAGERMEFELFSRFNAAGGSV
ncbi:HNH endonuclease-domain-containing protein [Tuber brumale]|nr:HNH endonuclease-domain-containing protein [Tuber brumale]